MVPGWMSVTLKDMQKAERILKKNGFMPFKVMWPLENSKEDNGYEVISICEMMIRVKQLVTEG